MSNSARPEATSHARARWPRLGGSMFRARCSLVSHAKLSEQALLLQLAKAGNQPACDSLLRCGQRPVGPKHLILVPPKTWSCNSRLQQAPQRYVQRVGQELQHLERDADHPAFVTRQGRGFDPYSLRQGLLRQTRSFSGLPDPPGHGLRQARHNVDTTSHVQNWRYTADSVKRDLRFTPSSLTLYDVFCRAALRDGGPANAEVAANAPSEVGDEAPPNSVPGARQ